MLRVISLGAGVQSTTMALMAAHGEIPPVDYAIFADTQWEPAEVYTHLDWLETQLPFPVFRVTEGNLREDVISGSTSTGARAPMMPLFSDGPNGRAMGHRQCTKNYKIIPVHRKLRELVGLKPRQRAPKEIVVHQLIGISTDEAMRAKPSQTEWVHHEFPLLDLGMSRRKCLEWFAEKYPGRKLAKSACIACPYHDDGLWRDMKINDPVSFADAVDFDDKIRINPLTTRAGKQPKNRQFVHGSMKPLKDVDFSTMEDLGQLNMFNNECEGMCGV